MLDDSADEDTDDSDTEQAPQKIQIMDFFKKKGHKPGPEQLGQPNVKEKEKIIDMSKDHMDVDSPCKLAGAGVRLRRVSGPDTPRGGPSWCVSWRMLVCAR